MKRYEKFLILIFISLTVYFVHLYTNEDTINYLVLGDSFSMGQNSFGGTTYGYEDYLKELFINKNKVNFYDFYTRKNNNIDNIYNMILKNENIVIDRNSYNLKKVLADADIITLSVGLNDIIYEYSLKNKESLSSYEENQIILYVSNNFKNLLREIHKYTKKKIYIVGYPEKNVSYQHLIKLLNNKYKELENEENIIYIDSSDILNKNTYFDNENSLFPNTFGYKEIALNLYAAISKSEN